MTYLRPPALPRAWRAVLFLLAGTSVASLLAWVYGLGSFDRWFIAVSVPGQILLIVVTLVIGRRRSLDGLHTLVLAGAIGGLIGTFGYDLFRLPFVLLGQRVLAPIDSYGVLAAGASSSSPWTGLLGWSYHFANGIGFGIAYAMLAARRHWGWGVLWALLLETVTVVSPFATLYALRGTPDGINWTAIAIAYVAHVPFGWAVGRSAQDPESVMELLRILGRRAVPAILATVVVGLFVWQAPWSSQATDRGRQVAEGASAVVVDGRFVPEWLRVPIGGCITLDNLDQSEYEVDVPGQAPRNLPRGRSELCFANQGVLRLRIDDKPYSGGFVIVDPAA